MLKIYDPNSEMPETKKPYAIIMDVQLYTVEYDSRGNELYLIFGEAKNIKALERELKKFIKETSPAEYTGEERDVYLDDPLSVLLVNHKEFSKWLKKQS